MFFLCSKYGEDDPSEYPVYLSFLFPPQFSSVKGFDQILSVVWQDHLQLSFFGICHFGFSAFFLEVASFCSLFQQWLVCLSASVFSFPSWWWTRLILHLCLYLYFLSLCVLHFFILPLVVSSCCTFLSFIAIRYASLIALASASLPWCCLHLL